MVNGGTDNKYIKMKNKYLIISLMFLLLFTSTVSATIYEYNSSNNKASFYEGNVIVGKKDLFATAELLTPLNVNVGYGQETKVFEMKITSFKETDDLNDLFDDWEFYNLKNDWEVINQNLTLKYKTQAIIQKPVYALNTTNTTNYYYQNGTVDVIVDVWNSIENQDTIAMLSGQTLTIGGFVTPKEDDYVEWIPTLFGYRIEEWATWSANLNTSLIAYYDFQENATTTGTIFDVYGVNDSTNNNAIGNLSLNGLGYYFNDTTNGIYIQTPTLTVTTMSLWVYWNRTADTWNYLFDGRTGINFGYLAIGAPIQCKSTAPSSFTNLWINNTLATCGSTVLPNNTWVNIIAEFTDTAGGAIKLGSDQNGDYGFDGIMDEVALWSRSLSASERANLSAGTYYLPASTPSSSSLDVNLISPANNTNQTSPSPILTWSVINNFTDISIVNTTLYLDGVAQVTNVSGINGTYNYQITLSDSDYHMWNVTAFDNNSVEYNSDNYNIAWSDNSSSIIVTLVSPSDNSVYSRPQNFISNVTSTYYLKNASLWTNESGVWELKNVSTSSNFGANNNLYTNSTDLGLILTEKLYAEYNMRGKAVTNVSVGFNAIAFQATEVKVSYEYTNGTQINISHFGGSGYNQTHNFTVPDYKQGINKIKVYGTGGTSNPADHRIYNASVWGFENSTSFAYGMLRSPLTTFDWGVEYCDYLDVCNFSSTNFTAIKDTTNPTISIASNDLLLGKITDNVNVTISLTEDNIDTCWYNNNNVNTTYTCTDESIIINITLTNLYDYEIITFYANDTFGNLGVSNNLNFTTISLTPIITYTPTVYEGDPHKIFLNLTTKNTTGLNGTLYYNNTEYTATIFSDNGFNASLNVSLNAPTVDSSQTVPLFFSYYLNGVQYNTSSVNQTIVGVVPPSIVSGSCGGGLSTARQWTVLDEINQSSKTVNVDYVLRYGIVNSSANVINGTVTGASTISLCLNFTENPYYLSSYGELQYVNSSFSERRFYIFDDTNLTATTIYENLYLLPNGEATSFLFEFISSGLNPYVDHYLGLLRWYPEDNLYRQVEMAKTDDKGQTIMRVKVEDVDYRVGLYQPNGTLVKLTNPVRFACLEQPCSYSVIVEDSESDYTSWYSVVTSIVFNETNNKWTATYSDSTQNTDNMRFVVRRERGDGYFTICDTNVNGYTGVLTCDSTGYTGVLRGLLYRTASPQVVIDSEVVNTENAGLEGTTGLLIGALLTVALALIGIFSPLAVIILAIVGVFFSYAIGAVTLSVFLSIGALGGLIIHFMRRSRG